MYQSKKISTSKEHPLGSKSRGRRRRFSRWLLSIEERCGNVFSSAGDYHVTETSAVNPASCPLVRGSRNANSCNNAIDMTMTNNNATLLRCLIVMGLLVALAGCKIVIETPKGGSVITESGNYACQSGNTCEVDVVDIFFEETFVARPDKDHVFSHWLKKKRSFCGDSKKRCELSTKWMDDYPAVLEILRTDQEFYLVPVFEYVPKIKAEDIAIEGDASRRGDTVDVNGGKVVVGTAGSSEIVFHDANLTLEFSDEDELVGFYGITYLPPQLSDLVTTQTNVRVEVGLYKGREINADDIYEITLRDERQYFVYLVSQEIDINVYNPLDRSRSEKLSIGTPASGKTILIMDPADQMVYIYGESAAVGAYGEAVSEQGLLPYDPWIKNKGFGGFDGYTHEKISVGVGIKVLDLLNLSGTQVIRDPQYTDIDWEKPFNSNISYKAGFNGAVDFAFGVAGFELLYFELAKASAQFTFDGSRGVIRLASEIDPDMDWLPNWVPVASRGRLDMDLLATSDGDLAMNVGGKYQSFLPAADLEGKIRVDRSSVVFAGRIAALDYALPLSIKFEDRVTTGRIGVTADFSGAVESGIERGFDEASKEVEKARADLEKAVANLDFELSLRGLRKSLPGVSDAAIKILDSVPERVYSEVYSRVRSEIDRNNKCVLGVCAISKSSRNKIASNAASSARSQAAAEIKSYKTMLTDLKRYAQEEDSERLRSYLESVLRKVYSYRYFSKTIKVKISVAGIFSTSYNYKVNLKILDNSVAEKILLAADNMKYIPEASDLVFRGQQIVDNLPDLDVIDRVRKEVSDGVRVPPGVSFLTYRVENGNYTARVHFTDGRSKEVNFNVLDPASALSSLGKLLASEAVAAASVTGS